MNSLIRPTLRPTALLLSVTLMIAPLVACGDGAPAAPPPAVDDSRGGGDPRGGGAPEAPEKGPMITKKQGVVILAGAAALYYLYKKHQSAPAAEVGEQGQYYLSKNGRVYYRDAEHRAHWVTPPPGGIAVPEAEAVEYRQFQGYDNQPSGRDLVGLGSDPE